MSKYNRTYHCSWSEGTTSDDRFLKDTSNLLNHEIVITEKLDGSNAGVTNKAVFARSHAAPSQNPWDVKMWELHDVIKWDIPDNMFLFGESMYAIHSISYNNLKSYFYLFNIKENDTFLSWKEVEEWAYLLNIPTVPILFKGIVKTEEELKNLTLDLMKYKSQLDGELEGLVIRIADSFEYDKFSTHVAKIVRKNHVKTDVHWTRSWQKAKLNL